MGPIGVARASRAVPARAPGREPVGRSEGDPRRLGGAVGQRQHPADLVRLHPDARRATGMTDATRYAILNANYIKARLQGHYDVLYANHNGRVAHEMIFDLRPFKHGAGPRSTSRTSPSG